MQRKVWDHLFGKEMFKVLAGIKSNGHFSSWKHCEHVYNTRHINSIYCSQVDFADTSIVITEPYFNFTSIQESMNEILFEEYQFQAALRINGELI